jgi:hypothetical protein
VLSALLLLGMAGALVAGLMELWSRAVRAEAASRQLGRLAEAQEQRGACIDEAALAAFEPPLRGVLRRQLEGLPASLPTGLALPLTGLLAVLGIIGGLLGVIDGVTAAGEALAAVGSTGVEGGLSAPTLGLADGLETTAAGLIAAVLLGGGLLGVRRLEAAVARQMEEIVAARPARGSVIEAQVDALQTLAQHNESLPAAAASMHEAAQQIKSLELSWAKAHERATHETLAVIREAVSEFRSDVKRAVDETARVTKDAVLPGVEQAIERIVAAATAHLDTVLETLTGDFDARREAERAHLLVQERQSGRLLDDLSRIERERSEAMSEQLQAVISRLEVAEDRAVQREEAQLQRLDSVAEVLEKNAQHTSELTAQQADDSGRTLRAVEGRADALLERLAEASAAMREAGADQLSAVAGYQQAAEDRLVRIEQENARALQDLFEVVREATTRQAGLLTGFEEKLAAQRETEIEQTRTLLLAHAEQLAGRLGETSGLVREAAGLVKAGGAEMSAVAEMFGSAVDRHREAAGSWLESLSEVDAAVEQAGRGAAADALREQLASTQEVFARQLEFERELFEQLRALRRRVEREDAVDEDDDSSSAAEGVAQPSGASAPVLDSASA